MIIGSLSAAHAGYHFARRRVHDALRRLFPAAAAGRSFHAQKRLTRGAYHAPNFMHSAHIWTWPVSCRYCPLHSSRSPRGRTTALLTRVSVRPLAQEYGIYVGAVVDGDSRMVLALAAFNNKLPITIYLYLFLPFIALYGFADQVITDKGPEFKMVSFVCLAVQQLTGFNLNRSAHKTTKSTSNVSHPTGPHNQPPPVFATHPNWLPLGPAHRSASRSSTRRSTIGCSSPSAS